MSDYALHVGDCREILPGLDPVDAVVTDPPYELEFMGRDWDKSGVAFDPETWRVVFNAMKPGAHLLAFGGTRTHHRLWCAIEDAEFEIRDTLAWLYGSGFPKSLNLDGDREGWGTALKPAYEPIMLARKPPIGTVSANVEAHGTGALNVDGCRIETEDDLNGGAYTKGRRSRAMAPGGAPRKAETGEYEQPSGRWPANVILDSEAAAMLDAQSGELHTHPGRYTADSDGSWFGANQRAGDVASEGDSGGASRFFYCAKASRAERGRNNGHPTVKPVDLMRWLVRLVTSPGGTILDPFMGSGTTGVACTLEGFDFIGIERDEEYAEIARRRIYNTQPSLFAATYGEGEEE